MSKTSTDSVAERRLRPIYDWLDNGNNKKAIQEADKVLKKQPDLLCAQVLKGLALLRLGKLGDCDDILECVQKKSPADDCTLQAMTICYRELLRVDKICEVYEKAVLKDPHNEELNTHLFMAYVRTGDYKKQYQVAMNLYKIKPKNPYYFWAVMSLLMQAQSNDDELAQKVTLPLAERMVKKFIDDGKIEAEQEIELYVMILEMQKKYKEALDVIDSDLSRKIVSHYMMPRKRIKLLQLLQNWSDLNTYIKKMIFEQPDSYNYYVIYIDSVLKLLKAGESNAQNNLDHSSICDNDKTRSNSSGEQTLEFDNTIESCVTFIQRCQNDNKCYRKLRGPYLASIFLFKRLSEEGYDPSEYLGNLLDLFKKYFELFADKLCCFKDIHQFLPMVQNEYSSLLSCTWTLIEAVKQQRKKHMMMHLTYFGISRYFGVHEIYSASDKLDYISKVLGFYHEAQKFNESLTPIDLGCNDTFMILIAHSLFDSYTETMNLKFIKDAICLLEYAYDQSPSNHHFKLLLLKFYNILGATSAGYKYFQLLEIKHMQYDSLGYLECWSLLYSGQYSMALHLLDNTIKFFTINYKEAADQLTHAYKYGSFEKVNEFLSFREKLKNSCHYRLVSVEDSILELLHSSNHELTIQVVQQNLNDLEQPSSDLSRLVDNRDLSVFLCFDPDTRRLTEEYRKISFEHELSLIRLRTSVLRCLGASIKACSVVNVAKLKGPGVDEVVQNDVDDYSNFKHLKTLNKYIDELKEIYKSFFENSNQKIPKHILSGLESSKYFTYMESSFFMPLFIDTMMFTHQFCRSNYPSDNLEEKQLVESAKRLTDSFAKLVANCNKMIRSVRSNCDEVNHRDIFEYLSLVIEIICIVCISCGNFHCFLSAYSKKEMPSKKKKKNHSIMDTMQLKNDDGYKQVIEESFSKIFGYYLCSVKDNVKLVKNELSNMESAWTSLKIHDFELLRCHIGGRNKGKEREESPVPAMSEGEWLSLQSKINGNLTESFRLSVKSFQNVLKNKLEYLSLLSVKKRNAQ